MRWRRPAPTTALCPVENSTEGAIGRTLDLLLAAPLAICGEVVLRVHHHLLGKGTKPESAQRLYSHAQSLAQCHEWLNRNLAAVPRVPVASNAEAARLAAQDATACAIAGAAAADLYGLEVLAANIEDDPNNTTRFLVLGRPRRRSLGPRQDLDRVARRRIGRARSTALLAPLAGQGVSMSKFESRPARELGASEWEYVFYVDMEGHRQEPAVAAALAEMRANAGFLKVLGSYPLAVY